MGACISVRNAFVKLIFKCLNIVRFYSNLTHVLLNELPPYAFLNFFLGGLLLVKWIVSCLNVLRFSSNLTDVLISLITTALFFFKFCVVVLFFGEPHDSFLEVFLGHLKKSSAPSNTHWFYLNHKTKFLNFLTFRHTCRSFKFSEVLVISNFFSVRFKT